MFSFWLFGFGLVGLTIGLIPLQMDGQLHNMPLALFCGYCGLMIGLSSFFIYFDYRKRKTTHRRRPSPGAAFIMILILMAPMSIDMILAEFPMLSREVRIEYRWAIRYIFYLFGFACYLGGNAVMILREQLKEREG